MEKIIVGRSGKRDYRFLGKLIAHNKKDISPGRYKIIELYITSGGNYVASVMYITYWQDEYNRYDAKLCRNVHDLQNYLGFDEQAKAIYEQADIDCADEIN